MYTVYALFDEREPSAVRYIGFSQDAERRLGAHIDEAKRSFARSHRLNWLRKATGFVRMQRLVVVATADEAAILEIAVIASYRRAGHRLVNGTEGGEGVQGFGGVLSAEALARQNASLNSPEYLARRSEQSADYWANEENREHQKQAMVDHWSSPEGVEHRQRNVDANKRVHTGSKKSPEARERMRLVKLGKPQMPRTEEWKEKIRVAQAGKKRRPWTEEERARHMAGTNREKMSASAKARKRQ